MANPVNTSPIAFAAVTDNGKGVSLNGLPQEAWTVLSGSSSGGDVGKLFRAVPWLYRGVHLRANAVAKLPFQIETLAGDVIDESKNYQNKIGFLPNPRRLLYLAEASLTVEGCCYFERLRGARYGMQKGLAYLHPDSVTPNYDLYTGEILTFTRVTRGGVLDFPLKRIVYTFSIDPYVEIGRGTSPARAALVAAGVLDGVDTFVTTFLARGAIKATILTIENSDADPSDKAKLKAWWKQVAAGVKGAFAHHVVSGKVKPEVIGEGIDSLSNQNLTREKREDVATALGIPHSLLFSDAANFATAQQDDLHFYDKTIVPEAELIQDSWNGQYFEPLGYRLRFLPDTLDIFQEDENERSLAYKNYLDSGMRPSVAAVLLGLELPQGVTPEQLDSDWDRKQTMSLQIAQARAQSMVSQGGQENQDSRQDSRQESRQNPPRPEPDDDDEQDGRARALRDDLTRWQKKALKSAKAGDDPAGVAFTSDVIPAALASAIRGQLEGVNDAGVKAVFDSALEWEVYP